MLATHVTSPRAPLLIASRSTKRKRLTWTPELHQRFLDAIRQLGLHRAVPKAILRIMDVPGMTRENGEWSCVA